MSWHRPFDVLTTACVAVAAMNHESNHLLYRVLTDATNQVFHAMLERVQKGDPIGHLRDSDGDVSSIRLPRSQLETLTINLLGPRRVHWR